jgi:hypothetical protein
MEFNLTARQKLYWFGATSPSLDIAHSFHDARSSPLVLLPFTLLIVLRS